MSLATMKELLEAGVHFGHYTRRWNPKMRPYIFTERNGIHIIDLAQTVKALDEAGAVVAERIAQGGTIMFVGTKKQAAESVTQAAQRVGMPYVTYRWLGGQLTNWSTMRQRVNYLLELEARRDRGEFSMLPKKEVLLLEREIEKLNKRLGGIKNMTELPDLLYIVDTRREDIAVKEANKLGIPIVGVVDTNCDPDPIQYVIPSNDDAIRAIKVITDRMAEAVEKGLALRERRLVDQIMGKEEVEVDTTQRVFDPFDETEPEKESEATAVPPADAAGVVEAEEEMLAVAERVEVEVVEDASGQIVEETVVEEMIVEETIAEETVEVVAEDGAVEDASDSAIAADEVVEVETAVVEAEAAAETGTEAVGDSASSTDEETAAE
jgi:small subunit ribosomal protein S2